MEIRKQTDSKDNKFLYPAVLPENKLPTYAEVLNYFLYLQKNDAQLTATAASLLVGNKVANFWEQCSIPIIQEMSISKKIRLWNEKYKHLLDNMRKSKKSKSALERFQELQHEAANLFDIACCNCIELEDCSCEESAKVPPPMRDFLNDQRNQRVMTFIQAKQKLRLNTVENVVEDSPTSTPSNTQESSYSAKTELTSLQVINTLIVQFCVEFMISLTDSCAQCLHSVRTVRALCKFVSSAQYPHCAGTVRALCAHCAKLCW